jgi:adenylate cyclase
VIEDFRSLLHELKRRKVIRMVIAYAAVSWLVIEVASVLEDALELPAWADTLVVVLVFLGFPVMVLLTWVFDITERGIERTGDVNAVESNRDDALRIGAPPAADDAVASVCVLTFEDLSPDGAHGAIAAGIASEIHIALGRMHRVRVCPRRSAMHFSASSASIEDITSALGVRYVLSGTSTVVDDRIRVLAELDDASTGSQVWSGSFERDLDDLLGVQTDLADAIVAAFGVERSKAEIDAARASPASSPDAWTLVQRARGFLLDYTKESMGEALELLRRGVALDPEYAAARAALASVLSERILNGYSEDTDKDRQESLEAAVSARQLAPSDPFVLKMSGMALAYGGRQAESLQSLRRAVEIAPFDFGAWGYLGWPLAAGGDVHELSELHQVMDRLLLVAPAHPGTPYWRYHKSAACLLEGDLDGATSLARCALDESPGISWIWLHLASIYGASDLPDEARAAVSQSTSINPAMSPALFAECLGHMSPNPDVVASRVAGLVATGLLVT